ncbi:hypothetical protein A3D84_05900 [Candidatus Woesebacteria bacterium RIFCSPHIGHO2_02_FULL_42_20]|uniref:Uncharacterized protein n=1 Tax=Candidatus Woesebacteria bacterium RIFCSPHIGHO2_12_FULL_41_24 TaxID=1802510 RepID=A0A1F8AT46_9BACT|nr:MAG: hypothetical protein A2873_04250 [Candidatus Woesebacteria bacterium RIFCSPHIGHO2_01_FULL_42_80]OGM35320.1 MAG: hypothetical protein A3D84_05900 [Candidatus Woesebacteria bacterium RIFCSPHIGHO2_02_FULL_42_20]OGM54933.1 MAG: hypothetical protein A3E44_03895 [Candidatus Woesebacteria bacterium RIFCSPHIGHO2_12_FULL_41_24]OGM67564.1 MAG: hypothetical protein A2969_01300 [Candidatus Woesebacteria bacterium RIFCSPLOWO2_01_FULL_42_67]OGM74008.1 MAG: hypothetical protein A3H21_04855 [Candidatus
MAKKSKGFVHIFILVAIIITIGVAALVVPKYLGTPNRPSISQGVYGKMIGISDVSTIPNYPLTDVVAVAIPRNEFDSWLSTLEKTEASRMVRIISIKLPVVLEKPNSRGNYEIALDPGDSALCFAWKGAEEGSYLIRRCVELEILEGKQLRVSYTSQFTDSVSCIKDSTCKEIDFLGEETTGWKTYRNEDIGFEIKNFGDSNLIELASRVWISKLGKNQSLQKYPDFISLTDGFVISIEKHENKGVLLETILNNEAQAYKTEKGSGSGKLLSGPNNHTFIEKSAYIMKIFQVVEITQVFIPKDNENYILITYAIEDPNNNSYETTLNQILSTFGFLGTPDENEAIRKSCKSAQGYWLEEYNECASPGGNYFKAGYDEECLKLGGKFQDCVSPCRHDLIKNNCETVCVQVCKF